MPYARPTLTDLRTLVAQDIAAELPGADALLRFSCLNILGDAQAALAFLHYGYLDWIAQQAVPFTATEEFLEGWAAVKDVFRKPATQATGIVTFSGAPGSVVPLGTVIVRGDGTQFTSTAAVTVGSGGTAAVPAVANADPTGQTGAFGSTILGTTMTLSSSVVGVQSNGAVTTAFTGGADLETDDALRARMLEVYQNPPQGGAQSDYVTWALQIPSVTRAWALRNGFGVGTVVVYVMLDISEAVYGGFPQGTNGVAASEPRGTAATGDQLLVANGVYPLQPVTALVTVVAPVAQPINFTIQGIGTAQRTAAQAAIAQVFTNEGIPFNAAGTSGGSVILAHIWSAIAAVTGVNDFVIQSPTADIATALGSLPTVGTVTWL